MSTKSTAVAEIRPTVVTHMGRSWTIDYVPTHLGMEQLGLTHLDNKQIVIRDGQFPLEEADTVLHEVLHVVDTSSELELTERQITVLAHALIGMFQDNPAFAEYVIKQRTE